MTRSGLICVSVAAQDAAGIIAAVLPVVDLIDVVEIRLDGMRHPAIEPCLAAIPRPVLVTNRPTWEGGQYAGGEQERIALLCQGIRAGSQYVDVELRTSVELREQVREAARRHGSKVILSSHNFQGTPPLAHLRETLDQMIAGGADIGKIVTTAATASEALRILALQQEALASSFPLSAFAMGAAGKISRLATLYLGGFMTYAAITAEQATAPGQLSVHDLQTLIAFFEEGA
jgi:3-dehydroquinate dehydratase-1/3-dehydroquinate dehydratase/shikimate dehydrogenase